jgi:hypothetical protein
MLAPMLLSRPTGTNSVVLKTKAPSASATTLSQAWAAVGVEGAGTEPDAAETEGGMEDAGLLLLQRNIVLRHATA